MAGCIKCGADIPMGAAKCEYCGAVVEQPKAAREPEASRASSVAGVTGDAPKFRIVSIGLMVVLAIVTIGIYIGAWFFARRKAFSELSPKVAKVSGIFGGLLGIQIFYALGYLGYIGTPDPDLLNALSIFTYVFWGVMIYASVIVRAALAEHAESHGRGGEFAGSILWAVVFNALYLKLQINRMIDARLLNKAP